MTILYQVVLTYVLHTSYLQKYCSNRCVILPRFRLSMDMSKLARDGTAEPVSRDQILRRERGQGNTRYSFSLFS